MTEQLFYRFIKLELTQFVTTETNPVDDDKPAELSSSFKFGYNFDEEVVCCTTTIIITKESCQILRAELNSYFKLQPESVASISENDHVILPTALMTQFASLTYGSMRGVIYAKTMGTKLEKIVLPPNDIQNIFTNPVKFRRPLSGL